jgi:uncharacterized protein YjiS (DUF1127 family)
MRNASSAGEASPRAFRVAEAYPRGQTGIGETVMFGEISRIARFVAERVKLWHSRARERQVLRELDDYMLRDIGLTRSDARMESERPFWRGDDARMTLKCGSPPAMTVGQTSHSWV